MCSCNGYKDMCSISMSMRNPIDRHEVATLGHGWTSPCWNLQASMVLQRSRLNASRDRNGSHSKGYDPNHVPGHPSSILRSDFRQLLFSMVYAWVRYIPSCSQQNWSKLTVPNWKMVDSWGRFRVAEAVCPSPTGVERTNPRLVIDATDNVGLPTWQTELVNLQLVNHLKRENIRRLAMFDLRSTCLTSIGDQAVDNVGRSPDPSLIAFNRSQLVYTHRWVWSHDNATSLFLLVCMAIDLRSWMVFPFYWFVGLMLKLLQS